MAWTTPVDRSPGYFVTDVDWNAVQDNLVVLRAGGVSVASQATGDFFYASSATQMGRVAIASAGTFIRSTGTLPGWSTLVLPNAATANRIPYATGTNTLGESASLTFDGTTFVGGSSLKATGSGATNILWLNDAVTGAGEKDWGIGVRQSSTNDMVFRYSSADNGTPDTIVFRLIPSGAEVTGTLLSTAGHTATAFIPTGSTVPANGMYLAAANAVTWASNSAERMRLSAAGGLSVGTTTDPGAGNVLVGTGSNQLGVGSILADAQFSLTGTFTGNSGNTLGYIAGLSLTTTLSPDVTRNAFVCRLAPTIVEAGSGTHALLAALRIILTITNGGATTTDAAGIDVNTFAAGAGTTTASGIRIDGPTGATNNWALNILNGASYFGGGVNIGGTTDPGAGCLSVTATFVVGNNGGFDPNVAFNNHDGSKSFQYTSGATGTTAALRLNADTTNEFVVQADGTVSCGGGFLMSSWPTTGSAANAVVTNGNSLSRSTSLREYKHDLGPVSLADARRVLNALSPIVYRSKIAQDDPTVLHVGLIAEDVFVAAPMLATFQDGVLGGVAYERVAMYLLPVVKDHESRLAALEARL